MPLQIINQSLAIMNQDNKYFHCKTDFFERFAPTMKVKRVRGLVEERVLFFTAAQSIMGVSPGSSSPILSVSRTQTVSGATNYSFVPSPPGHWTALRLSHSDRAQIPAGGSAVVLCPADSLGLTVSAAGECRGSSPTVSLCPLFVSSFLWL